MSPIVTGTHLCGETPTRSERRVLSKPLTCTFILRLPPQHSACTQEFRVLRPLRSALDGRRRATGARRCRALRLPSHARAASVRPSPRPRPRSARKRKTAAKCACKRPAVGRGLCCPTPSRVTVPGLRQPEPGLQEGRAGPCDPMYPAPPVTSHVIRAPWGQEQPDPPRVARPAGGHLRRWIGGATPSSVVLQDASGISEVRGRPGHDSRGAGRGCSPSACQLGSSDRAAARCVPVLSRRARSLAARRVRKPGSSYRDGARFGGV